jgi:hypothetical protein
VGENIHNNLMTSVGIHNKSEKSLFAKNVHDIFPISDVNITTFGCK